jgi:hypothetical protein
LLTDWRPSRASRWLVFGYFHLFTFLRRGRKFHTLQMARNAFGSSQALENRTIHREKIGRFCKESSLDFH